MTCFIHCSLPRVAASVACLLALFAPLQSRSQALKGAQAPLAWETLVLAKANPKKPGAEVEFPAALAGLNGKAVVVKGFMVPLEAKAEQTRFLLTQKPQDCEFCIEGGPSSYIEVQSAPMRYRSQLYTLTGRLHLLRNDPSGMYYRLTEARLADR